MRWLVDEAYPDVPVIRLVLDNLNTHRTASLYETFPPAEARRIAKRLEFHHTPKHGSWLNMAEIEFSVLARAYLKGRNPDEDALQRNISAYEAQRNSTISSVKPCSSSPGIGSHRCVDLGWHTTLQARRSETPNISLTCSTHWRRREGLRSFPPLLLSVSDCPTSDQPLLSSNDRSRSPVASAV